MMAKMFRLLRELTSSRTPKKVLIREEANNPVTKNINAISLINMEKEKGIKGDGVAKGNVIGLNKQEALDLIKSPDKEEEMEEETDSRSVGSMKEELTGVETKAEALVETPSDSLLVTRLGKMDHETCKSLPVKFMYNAILKKKLVKKDDMEGNFVIPCSIGGIKYVNALIYQGSDVNVMPMSFYSRLTNKEPVGTDVRLSLASHSYIYPLGIAGNVMINIAGYVYPADFVILNIKVDRNKPFILGTPFLTTAKTVIRFEKGTITLKSGKNKIDFVKVPALLSELEKNAEDDLDPITLTNTVSKLILEWEERIKHHQEKEMDFNQ
ncbi:MAK10-like protein [Tanacetum coccineum]